MLTKKEAFYYDEQLHPAFAGYLHDGTITKRDALATLFNLLTRGLMDPIFIEHNILKGVAGGRKMRRKPKYHFEQLIVDELFKDTREVSAKKMGAYIETGKIQKIIKENLNALAHFPIIREKLNFRLGKHGVVKFSTNGDEVDTIEEASFFRNRLYKVITPIFLGIGFLLTLAYFFLKDLLKRGDFSYSSPNVSIQIQSNGDSASGLILTAAILIIVILAILLSFIFSKKEITYDFQKDIVPVAKQRYEELYKFLENHPLQKHRFTNEFLAFSIAFGLDDSWFADFGLDKEIKIDKSPIISNS